MADLFPTLCLVGVRPDSSALAIQYEFGGFVAHETQVMLNTVAEVFAGAAALAMFPGSSQRDKSTAEFVPDGFSSAAEFVQVLKCENLDSRAFQCLRNMVRRLRRFEIMIKRIAIVDRSSRVYPTTEIQWPGEANEDDVYPDAVSKVAEIMRFEDTDFGKSRRCLVELRTSPQPETFHQFEMAVGAWYKLLEAGAYALPVGLPEEVDSIAGTVNQFDKYSIEIGINRFVASEKAWNPLANIASAFWAASLQSISID